MEPEELLPEQTSDDIDVERVRSGDRDGHDDHDEWLREQVPPHHG